MHVHRAVHRALLPGVALGVAGIGIGMAIASMRVAESDVIEYASKDVMLKVLSSHLQQVVPLTADSQS